MNYSQRYKKQ